ncbi:MAG: Split AAA-ATPase protein PA0787, partial [uncultured Acetobacteraceae bacterium]
ARRPSFRGARSRGQGVPFPAVGARVHRAARGFRRRQRRRQEQPVPRAATAAGRGGGHLVASGRRRRRHGSRDLGGAAAAPRAGASGAGVRPWAARRRRGRDHLFLRRRTRLPATDWRLKRSFPRRAAGQGGALPFSPRTPAGGLAGATRPGRLRPRRGGPPVGSRHRPAGIRDRLRRTRRSAAFPGASRGAARDAAMALLPRSAHRPGFAAPPPLAGGGQPGARLGRWRPRRRVRHARASAAGYRGLGSGRGRRVPGGQARRAIAGTHRRLRAGLPGPPAADLRRGRTVRRHAALSGARRRAAVLAPAALPCPERAGVEPAPRPAGTVGAVDRLGCAPHAGLGGHAFGAARRRARTRGVRPAEAHRQGSGRDGDRRRRILLSEAREARPV